MLISQVTLDAYVPVDPKRVLALYEKSGSAELCLSYWSETLTPDGLRKIIQTARAAKALAVPALAEAAAKPPVRHHRRMLLERELAIVAALAIAECVADVSASEGVSEQVIYRICNSRGITWPALSPQRRAERIKAAHARAKANKAAEVPAPILARSACPEPVQLDLLEWFAAQTKRARRGKR